MTTTTATSAEAEEWVSRADAAKLARCSEDVIKRDEKKHGLTTRLGTRGRTMLRLADLVAIRRIRTEDLPTGASAAETAELRRSQDELRSAERALGEVRGRLAERDELVAVLKGQLGEKDRQIKDLTGQVTSLVQVVRERASR